MKEVERLDANFLDMENELVVNNNKTSREISGIFNDELKHFYSLLMNFKFEHGNIDINKIDGIVNELKHKFNSVKVMLVDEYQERFEKNNALISSLMHDFYLRSLKSTIKNNSKEINRHLNEMCRFDFFLIEDKIENDLMDFSDEFDYRYINTDDAKRDFDLIIKNIKHSLICELRKAINNGIDDKRDIIARYNTSAKEIVKEAKLKNNFKR